MSAHTPEPWEVYGDGLGIRTTVNGFRVVRCDQANRNAYENARERAEGLEGIKANAARIVACVNAFAGIDDPQAAIALLKADYLRALNAEAQRDELLAALKLAEPILDYAANVGTAGAHEAHVAVRDAIAKVKP